MIVGTGISDEIQVAMVAIDVATILRDQIDDHMPFQLSLATLAMQSQQIKETCQKLCRTFRALFCLFSRFPSLLYYTELPSSLLLPCKTIHAMP